MHLMYGNVQLNNSQQANTSQCWYPCHETLTKWATNKFTPALACKKTTCTQHQDLTCGPDSFPCNNSTFMKHLNYWQKNIISTSSYMFSLTKIEISW